MRSVSTIGKNSVKSRLADRMLFIAPCSRQIHPSGSCPLEGRAHISSEESVCMSAHTRSPASTLRSYQAAYNKSRLTDTGDGVGANTSSLTVVAKSFRNTSRSRIVSCHPSRPTCEQDGFARRYICLLIQEYSCISFIRVISRSCPSLTLSAGSPSIKIPS